MSKVEFIESNRTETGQTFILGKMETGHVVLGERLTLRVSTNPKEQIITRRWIVADKLPEDEARELYRALLNEEIESSHSNSRI